jgi:hypothetical protein
MSELVATGLLRRRRSEGREGDENGTIITLLL